MRAALLATLLLAPMLAGCLGGEARTEWAYTATQLSDMNAQGRTGRGVVVAILDTGINRDHAALAHLFDGDRQNGEVVAYQDFYTGAQGAQQATDEAGHGSHVAGIIAARGSSLGDKLVYGGVDLMGGAPDVDLVIGKVCGAEDCKGDALPAAVRWAREQRADVISLSLGGQRAATIFGLGQASDQLTSAIQAAIDSGIVVIASAGNEGPSNVDVSTPADIPDVIAVGAVGENGAVWDNSSRGDTTSDPCRTIPILNQQTGRCDPNKKPELVAPGVDILSPWRGDQYVRATGTSQATPFVTAAVALILEGRPDLDGRDGVMRVKAALERSARPVPRQQQPHDPAAGYGFLQAKDAFDAYARM